VSTFYKVDWFTRSIRVNDIIIW